MRERPERQGFLGDGAVLAVVLLALALVVLVATGCADVRMPAWYSDGHVEAAARDVAEIRERVEPESEDAERLETLDFHLRHARAWTGALLKHKGAPPGLPKIAEGPADAAGIAREKADLREYEAAVEAEHALRSAASGWMLKALGGGATGVGGLMILFRKRLMKRAAKMLAGMNGGPPPEEPAPKRKRGSA